MSDYLDKQDKALYALEMDLRNFIVEHDISDPKLAELMNLLPVGVEVLWCSIWTTEDCFRVATALGLVIEFNLKNDQNL